MAVSNEGGSPIVFTASGDVSTQSFILDSLRWVGAGTAGDVCKIHDSNGNLIFASTANGANFIDGWVWKRNWLYGITITQMTSGVVYMYKAAN